MIKGKNKRIILSFSLMVILALSFVFASTKANTKVKADTTHEPTVTINQIGAYSNNNNSVGGGCRHVVIEYSKIVADSSYNYNTVVNATENETSLNVKFNGETYYNLYQVNQGYVLHFQPSTKFIFIDYPESALTPTTEYPVPTITIAKGTPVADEFVPELTLYYYKNSGCWGTTAPQEANVFVTSAGVGSIWNNTVDTANGVSQTIFDYSGTLNESPAYTNYASSQNPTSDGILFNGVTFSKLYTTSGGKYCVDGRHGANHFYIYIPVADLVATEAYPIPTLEVKSGTPYGGKFLGGFKAQFVNDKWTIVEGEANLNINPSYNNIVDGGINWLILDSSYNFITTTNVQVHPTKYSGFKYNGVNLEFNKIVLRGPNKLWLRVATENCVPGYNLYSHPTLEIEDGAYTVDNNGLKTYYDKHTYYLVNGLWTETKPSDYKMFSGFITLNMTTDETKNEKNEFVLDFSGLSENVLTSEYVDNIKNNLKFDGTTLLKDIENATIVLTSDNKGVKVTLPSTCSYSSISLPDIVDTSVNYIIKSFNLAFYYNRWFDTSKYTKTSFSAITWNNIDYMYNDHRTFGVYGNTTIPSQGTCVLITYDSFLSKTAAVADFTNRANESYEVGSKIKANGIALKDIPGAIIDYPAAQGHIYIYVPILGSDIQITIEEGTIFMDSVLGATSVYASLCTSGGVPSHSIFVVGTNNINYTNVSYSKIEWNNKHYQSIARVGNGETAEGSVPTNGVEGLISFSSALSSSGFTSCYNYVASTTEIGNKMKLNGVPFKDIEGAWVDYGLASTFLFFYVPKSSIPVDSNYKYPTLTIEAGTHFQQAILPSLTLYFYNNCWNTEYLYDVTFDSKGGTAVTTLNVKDGQLLVPPTAPTKESTISTVYTFTYWYTTDENTQFNLTTPITSDLTLNAKWTESVRKYTIKFMNGEAELQSSEVDYNTLPVYSGTTPTKEADNTYTYSFNTWDKTIANVSGDETYSATFTPTYIDYTVKFMNGEATVSSATYHYGDTVVVPQNPSKDADNTYTYTFNAWDAEVTTCDGDKTYNAVFTPVYIDYTITFVAEGKEISSATYHYGDTVVVPANPTKAADNTYTYGFVGWNTEVVAVDGNKTYTAVFAPTNIDYTIRFVSEGKELSSTTYHFGDTVVAPTPTKESDNTYSYTFKGWDTDVTTVKGDKTYTATFERTYINYVVKFEVNGVTVVNKKYHYGDTVKVPQETPTKKADNTYTYEFKGWSPEINETVSASVTYVAEFTETYKEYTVKFVSNGNTLSETVYHYNDEIVVPENPTKASTLYTLFTFNGWGTNFSTTAKENVTYTAVFTESDIKYTVEFKWDNKVLFTKDYFYGATPVYTKEAPVKENTKEYTYKFLGWDKQVVPVTENATYNAVFSETKNSYTVSFVINGIEVEMKDEVLEYGTFIDLVTYNLQKTGYVVESIKVNGQNLTKFTVEDDTVIEITYIEEKQAEKEEKEPAKEVVKEYSDDMKIITDYAMQELKAGCESNLSSNILTVLALSFAAIVIGFVSRKRKED